MNLGLAALAGRLSGTGVQAASSGAGRRVKGKADHRRGAAGGHGPPWISSIPVAVIKSPSTTMWAPPAIEEEAPEAKFSLPPWTAELSPDTQPVSN
jgi:hypothetical protein